VIRTVWTMLNAIVGLILIGGAVVIAGLLRLKVERFYSWAAQAWSAWILWASGVPVEVEGLEHVPQDKPEIFVSNHQSWFDVFVLAVHIPKRARFVAKKELERIPIFGRAWKAAGHISIDRQDRASAIQSLDRAARLLRQDNSSVVIFAEGTRSADGTLKPFKKGAFMLALHSGVDIIPTAVLGSYDVMPRDRWQIRKLPIIVRFGEPIRSADFREATREELIAEVHRRVAVLLDQPHPRLPRGNRTFAHPTSESAA